MEIDPDNDDLLRHLLNFDPIAAAENESGDVDDMKALKAMSSSSAAKEEILEERLDTTFSMEMDEYRKRLRGMGFELVLAVGIDRGSASRRPEDVTGEGKTGYAYWHSALKVLVWTTDSGEKRNDATAYFSIDNYGGHADLPQRTVGISGSQVESGQWVGSFDAREALEFKLGELINAGNLTQDFDEPPLLLQLTTSQDYDYHDDMAKVRNRRKAMLPCHVAQSMNLEINR